MALTTLTPRVTPYKGPTGRSGLINTALTVPSLAIVLAILPLSAIRYILQRPRGWTLKLWIICRAQRLMAELVRTLPAPETDAARWGMPRRFGSLKGADVKVDRVSVAPAPAEWLGALAEAPKSVKPIKMPGFMIVPSGAESGMARPGEMITMYIHGGGYIRGHPLFTAFPFRLAYDTSRRLYSVQYRKTLDASTAFPAPLIDALAAWVYLTCDLGFEPSNIVLAGDSAGAHLSLALCQQLRALGKPLPGALALSSPWVDFTCSFPSWDKHKLDFISKSKLSKAIASATRHYDPSELAGPFFSPSLAPAGHWKFLAGTPVFISYGGIEAFSDEDEALAAALKNDGVEVTLFKDEHGIHDTPVLSAAINDIPHAFEGFRDGVKDLFLQLAQKQDN